MLQTGQDSACGSDCSEAAAAAAAASASSPGPEVGRLVDSSQADDRKMIRLVKARRLLYARSNMPVASFYSKVKSLWQEVADEMGWTVPDVRRKWSHIRNSYSRHLRNELLGARTGRGRMVSRWYLADELEFLREHMATDTRPSPYGTYAPTLLSMSESQHDMEHLEVKSFIPSPWFAAGSPPAPAQVQVQLQCKAEPPAPASSGAGSAHDEDSCSSHNFAPDENSSYFQFFRGIHGDYQELSPRKQRQFKRQCLEHLHSLLDEGDLETRECDQNDAVNLSHSSNGDAKEQKYCVVEKLEQYVIPHD